MPILAGQIVTTNFLNRLRPTEYDVGASGTVVLTASLQDITGASIALVTQAANAVYKAKAAFDINVATASAGQTAEGHLDIGGVDQARRALKLMTAVDRATVYQQWSGVLAAAGAHTFKLRGVKSGAGGVASIVTTHTTLQVVIYEVV